MTTFNWEDFEFRVAELTREGVAREAAERTVQEEMVAEQEEYEAWLDEMEATPDEKEEMAQYFGA